MGHRNDGQGEINALQNRFTAYLLKALKRKKHDHISKQMNLKAHEFSSNFQRTQFSDDAFFEMAERFSPLSQIEDLALMEALARLTAKERYILFGRVLIGYKYDELANDLGLQYNGIATAYHRIIKKLRKELKGE